MCSRGKTAAPAQVPAKRLRVRKKKPADKALRKKKAVIPKKAAPAKPAAPAVKTKPKPKHMTKAEIAKARAEKLAAKAAKPKVKPAPKKAPAKEEAGGAKKLPAVPEILLKRRKRRVAAKKHKIAAIIQVNIHPFILLLDINLVELNGHHLA